MNHKPLPPAIQSMLSDMDRQAAKTLASLMPKPSPQAELWGKAAMQLMQRGAARRRARAANELDRAVPTDKPVRVVDEENELAKRQASPD